MTTRALPDAAARQAKRPRLCCLTSTKPREEPTARLGVAEPRRAVLLMLAAVERAAGKPRPARWVRMTPGIYLGLDSAGNRAAAVYRLGSGLWAVHRRDRETFRTLREAQQAAEQASGR